uniref:Uncharacterized protein n=1 Tax=viral metagenome TaxID=1070528 RepID=A0A6M3ILD0_9ZZZZ
MARSYTVRNLVDDNKGRPLANVWCRAFNASTSALVETQYTDATGACTFTTLPDDANINLCAVWGNNVKWMYNIFSATQDLLYLSVTDAVIQNLSVGKLTAGNLTVAATLSGSGVINASAGVKITSTGINIFGVGNALTTRATETGTIQCYVGSDGKIYAGAGAVYLDAGGLHVNTAGGSTHFHVYYGSYDGYIYESSAGVLTLEATDGQGIQLITADGTLDLSSSAHRIQLPTSTTYVFSAGTCDLGSATYPFRRVYGDPVLRASDPPPSGINYAVTWDSANHRILVRHGTGTYYFVADGLY